MTINLVLALYTYLTALCYFTWLKDEPVAIGIWFLYPVGVIAIILAWVLA